MQSMSKKAKGSLFFLYHIKESIEAIESYLKENPEALISNRMVQKAVLYELVTIGEAANNLSDKLKAMHPEVPWRDIVDFRNVLAHHYWAISLEIVGKIIKDEDKLPTLKRQVELSIEQLENSTN
jgi:uncharacterized protein with HEPN domain